MTEESEFSDAINTLQHPDALTLTMIEAVGGRLPNCWITGSTSNRARPYRLALLGYSAVVNPDSKARSTRWRFEGRRQTVYAKDSLSERDRIAAVMAMLGRTLNLPSEKSEQNQW
jgi:hypothetical protein